MTSIPSVEVAERDLRALDSAADAEVAVRAAWGGMLGLAASLTLLGRLDAALVALLGGALIGRALRRMKGLYPDLRGAVRTRSSTATASCVGSPR